MSRTFAEMKAGIDPPCRPPHVNRCPMPGCGKFMGDHPDPPRFIGDKEVCDDCYLSQDDSHASTGHRRGGHGSNLGPED